MDGRLLRFTNDQQHCRQKYVCEKHFHVIISTDDLARKSSRTHAHKHTDQLFQTKRWKISVDECRPQKNLFEFQFFLSILSLLDSSAISADYLFNSLGFKRNMSTGKLKMNELLGDDYFKPISYS